MPSTNNPNLPRSEKHKIRTRKAAKAKVRASSRIASQPAPLRGQANAGVTKTTNTKKQKKLERNKIYADQRKVEAAAEELLKTKGEVEMAGRSSVW
jgi:hypothetical protein